MRAFTITGRRALADDVVQDAFERAFRSLPTYEPTAPFERWLARIVTNRAIDLLRRERREAPLEEAAEVAVEWAGNEDDAALRRAVAALEPERRLAVVLRYWLDMTPAEIAELSDTPVGTVHSRLARGLADLRRVLVEHPDV